MGCEDSNKTGAEKCKGLKPRTVKLRQGDMMLCDDCNERRFGKPNTARLNQGMMETPKRSDQQQGKNAPGNATKCKRNTPAKMSVQEAANAVEVTHLKNIDNMTLAQLKAFDLEATRILVQGTVASLVPMDADPTSIANESIAVYNKLKAHVQVRTDNLQGSTFSPSALAERILTPLRNSNTTNVTQPKVACLDTCNNIQAKGKTISCSLCQEEFHTACVGVSARKTVWFCTNCRNISRSVKEMKHTLTTYQKRHTELSMEK